MIPDPIPRTASDATGHESSVLIQFCLLLAKYLLNDEHKGQLRLKRSNRWNKRLVSSSYVVCPGGENTL